MGDEIPQRDNNRPERAGIKSNTASGDNSGEPKAQSKSRRLADLIGQCFLLCSWLTITGSAKLQYATTSGALFWLLGVAVFFTHVILRAVRWTKSVVQKVSDALNRKKVVSAGVLSV